MSFAACGEARDAEFVTTRAEGKGKESVLCEVSILFSFVCRSFIICVAFSVCVEAVDGSSVIGFPDNGEAKDGPSGGGS